jgi:hypothetical protein
MAVGYMKGSKMARHTSSIVHRTNVCGGPAKGGLAPLVRGRVSRDNWNWGRAGATSTRVYFLCKNYPKKRNPATSGGVGRGANALAPLIY